MKQQHFTAGPDRNPVFPLPRIITHQLSTTGEWFAWREFGPLSGASGWSEEEAIDALLVREMK
jgi:hypothetical protein